MRKQSKNLKVTLTESVTERVRKSADKNFTTPPRLVNKVLAEHLPKK